MGDGCKAIVYQRARFRGWRAVFPAGEYNNSRFIQKGARNDDASSLRVMRAPTSSPTITPTSGPTGKTKDPPPTKAPTNEPTSEPTQPTAQPTEAPPTKAPTNEPTSEPTQPHGVLRLSSMRSWKICVQFQSNFVYTSNRCEDASFSLLGNGLLRSDTNDRCLREEDSVAQERTTWDDGTASIYSSYFSLQSCNEEVDDRMLFEFDYRSRLTNKHSQCLTFAEPNGGQPDDQDRTNRPQIKMEKCNDKRLADQKYDLEVLPSG